MVSPSVSVVAELRSCLGEGLHWDSNRMVLWMVDILGRQLLSVDPVTGRIGRRDMPEAIGWVLPIQHSRWLLLGLASGLAALDPVATSTELTWIDRSFPGDKDFRLNDAKADRFGRIWAGSTSIVEQNSSSGVLARFSFGDANWEVIDSGYSVPNGPAFNVEGNVMLHSDSLRGLVYRFDLNPETGDVVRRSVWRQFDSDIGYPDGMTFDADGFVWIAHWGRGQVRRYELSGRLSLTIDLPTVNVTSVCFGGPELDRLFVTSARKGLEPRDTLAGSLFEIKNHETQGLRQHQVQAMTSQFKY